MSLLLGRRQGRLTAEGEFIPVRIEQLEIGYIDGMLCVADVLNFAPQISTAFMGDFLGAGNKRLFAESTPSKSFILYE